MIRVKKMKKHSNKLNNKGFTLVELILAMIILAAVIGPFLHAFMTSTKMNMKSRNRSQATTLAQNVMEGLKTEAYLEDGAGNYTDVTLPHLQTVMNQFTYPTIDSTYDNFFVLPKENITSATVGEIIQGTPSIVSADGGRTSTFNERDDYRYYMYLLNVKQQGSTFDILVTLDGSEYGESATSGQNFNAAELVQIPSIDTNFDAVCTKNFDTEAYANFSSKVVLYGDTYNEANQSRTITIDITTDNAGKVRVTAKYDYSYKVSNGTVLDYNCQEVTIFNGNATDFRNVYLYYYPNYGSTPNNPQDKIVINNNLNTDSSIGRDPYHFTLFLVKQEDTSLSPFDLKTKENNYRCLVYMNNANHVEAAESPVLIKTNLGTNLYSAYDLNAGVNYTIKDQAIYLHNGLAYSENEAFAKYEINVVTNRSSKTAYLKTTVSVYDHTLESTPSLTDFTSQNPIVTLEGSFVN